jgi:LuxR family maltose regulon positive regulatory protein
LHSGESATPPPSTTHTAIEIVWLAKQEEYVLRIKSDGALAPLPRQPEEWRAWLESQSAFTFRGQRGRLTLRRETRKGRPIYWYAFRHCLHRTFKQYAGKTESLTLERLEEVAARLELGCRRLRDYMRARHEHGLRDSRGPLLQTRLRPPALPGDLIRREHLLTLLDRGRERRLILLCAPAGSGKSSLVRQWLAHLAEGEGAPPVAWLTLDAADNEPLHFWRYLVAACAPWLSASESQRLAPTPASSLATGLAGLASVGVAPSSVSEILADQLVLLLNFLSQHDARGLLILENYHLINAEVIHQALAFLVGHLPAGLCLVLLTREEPPLPLASLRASGALLELRGPELRLSQAESAAFLRPYGLAPEQLEQIDQLIAGWPAGLRLLSLLLESARLAGERDGRALAPAALERLLSDFRGSQRPLFDYFSSEVLQGLPPHLQDFLLRTCWLPRLQPDLCCAVSPHNLHGSAALLEELERRNLFIEPLDPLRRIYRYYPLFAEALQHEARRRLPREEVRLIHYQASRWYANHGQLEEAIELALQSGVNPWVAELIERFTIPLRFLSWGDHNALQRLQCWLEAVPEPLIWSRPQLCLVSALVIHSFLRGQRASFDPEHQPARAHIARINDLLQRAEELWRQSDDRAGLGQLYACRMLTLEYLPTSPRQPSQRAYQSAVYARAALEYLPPEESDWRLLCLGYLFGYYLQSGNLKEAETISRDIESLMQIGAIEQLAPPSEEWFSGFSSLRASLATLAGKLQTAAYHYRYLASASPPQRPPALMALMGQAQILYDRNDLAGAEEQLDLLEERLSTLQAGASDERDAFLFSLLSLDARRLRALISQARGQLDAARESLRLLLLQTSATFPHPGYNHYPRAELLTRLARLDLARGDLEAARESADELGRLLGLKDHYELAASPDGSQPLLTMPVRPDLAVEGSTGTTSLAAAPPAASTPIESQGAHLVAGDQAPNGLVQEQYRLLVARLLLANGQARQAIPLLENIHEQAWQSGRGRGLLQARLLLARAYAQEHDPVLAGTFLGSALEQGQIEGHRRIFLDEGEPLAALLRELLPRVRGQTLRAYAESLLQDFAVASSQQPPIITPAETLLPEPLSAQELRILRLLAAGYSNAEIAEELIVSVNTVRTHIQHLYQKLNVHNRHRAIATARRYGLL